MKSVKALNQKYFENYGQGHYDQNYKYLGFSLPAMLQAFRQNDLWPTSLLDCGAATGLTIRDFRKAGISAYGIEIAPYAAERWPNDLRRYLKIMDMREISKFRAGAFDCIYSNANMYLTREENLKWLKDAHRLVNQSIYLITPFADFPDSIPKDSERKFLETKQWWLDQLASVGFERCRGGTLFRKLNQ